MLRKRVAQEQEAIHIGVTAFLVERRLSRYGASPAENGITEELLLALTNDELNSLEVEALGERKRILATASRLFSANRLESLFSSSVARRFWRLHCTHHPVNGLYSCVE